MQTEAPGKTPRGGKTPRSKARTGNGGKAVESEIEKQIEVMKSMGAFTPSVADYLTRFLHQVIASHKNGTEWNKDWPHSSSSVSNEDTAGLYF